jgi:hypothetical protein
MILSIAEDTHRYIGEIRNIGQHYCESLKHTLKLRFIHLMVFKEHCNNELKHTVYLQFFDSL